jgi:hypothetical protein
MLAYTIEVLIKGIIVVSMLMLAAAYMTYLERVVMARMQLRIGPNRVGPLGLLQPIADGIKLLCKERFQPANVDNLPLHRFICLCPNPSWGDRLSMGSPHSTAYSRCQCGYCLSACFFLTRCLWCCIGRLGIEQSLFTSRWFAKHSSNDKL